MKAGDVVEAVQCSLHGWGLCNCVGRGPWFIVDGSADSEGRIIAKDASGKRSLVVAYNSVRIASDAVAAMLASSDMDDDSMPGLTADTASDRRSELRADVVLMRELGVTKWRDIELGPAPVAGDEKTQPGKSPEEREIDDARERRRIALRASGGPVPRLSGLLR